MSDHPKGEVIIQREIGRLFPEIKPDRRGYRSDHAAKWFARFMDNPVEAEGQAVAYAKQLDVPFVFLTNGEEIWFWEYEREAHPHQVKTFFAQEDLERRIATLTTRRDPTVQSPSSGRFADGFNRRKRIAV